MHIRQYATMYPPICDLLAGFIQSPSKIFSSAMSGRLRVRHTDDHHQDNPPRRDRDVEAQEEKKEHVPHGVYYRHPLFVRLTWYLRTNFMVFKGKRTNAVVGSCIIFIILVTLICCFYQFSAQSEENHSTKVVVSSDILVSVVIMNYSRPRMLQESNLISTLGNHPNIAEILLCHANPKTKFHHAHPKVRNLDAVEANQQYGLSLRFRFAASEAKYPWVIHVDDDQELSAAAISQLLAEFSTDSHRIVGRYGRSFSLFWNPQRHGYNTRTILGPVEVVLTKFMVMETRLCQYFVDYQYLIDPETLAESHPLWNGEDIFMSLVANHVYGVPLEGPYRNYAFNLNVWEASDALKDDDSGTNDVSGNMDRHRLWNVGWTAYWAARRKAQLHTAYRGRLWESAKHKLSQLPTPVLA